MSFITKSVASVCCGGSKRAVGKIAASPNNMRLKNADGVVAGAMISAPFNGTFPPGKFTVKEHRHLKQAEKEVDTWNQALTEARERLLFEKMTQNFKKQ